MKTIDKLFRLELTETELEIITNALHGEYKFVRSEREKADNENAQRLAAKMQDVRALRNGFAALIGHHYCGEDA